MNINPSTYIFRFGTKYKNKPYSYVKRIEPGYILWCVNNLAWFKISSEEQASF